MTTANATTNQSGHRLTCYNNNNMVDAVSNKITSPNIDSYKMQSGKLGDLPNVFGGSFNLIYKYLINRSFFLTENIEYGRSGRFKLVVIGGRTFTGTAYTIYE